MRTLFRWLDTAIAVQPFYAAELGAARMLLDHWRHSLPGAARFRPH